MSEATTDLPWIRDTAHCPLCRCEATGTHARITWWTCPDCSTTYRFRDASGAYQTRTDTSPTSVQVDSYDNLGQPIGVHAEIDGVSWHPPGPRVASAPASWTAVDEAQVDHPTHYQGARFEVIDIIEDFCLGFCLGNTIKYVLRAGHKGDAVTDLKKARWYLDREIAKREGGAC